MKSAEAQAADERVQAQELKVAELTKMVDDLRLQVANLSKVQAERDMAVQEVAELEQQLATVQARQQKHAQDNAATTLIPGNDVDSPRPGQLIGGEVILPDFVWKCGSSQVMEYVQKLAAEVSALRLQSASAVSPNNKAEQTFKEALNDSPALLASSLFDTNEVNVERALAFLGTIGESDGHQIQPLLKLLEEYADNIQVCSQACGALESLTFTDVDNRQAIAQKGGVEAILSVLQRHQDADPALLRFAVDALWNLTFDDEAVDRATKANGIESVLSAMKAHVGAMELQAGACAVLLNLAVRAEHRWKIVQAGGVELIVTAMQQHSHAEEVLEQGCQTLYMLAYHQDLRHLVLASKGGDAAALAIASMNTAGRAQKWGHWLQEALTF